VCKEGRGGKWERVLGRLLLKPTPSMKMDSGKKILEDKSSKKRKRVVANKKKGGHRGPSKRNGGKRGEKERLK